MSEKLRKNKDDTADDTRGAGGADIDDTSVTPEAPDLSDGPDVPEESAGQDQSDSPDESETSGNESAESCQDSDDAQADGDADLENKYLRMAADFQNYKKRNERERFERYSDGKRDFAADLLPVLDNFERAISQDMAKGADESFVAGMKMIYEQLAGALEKNGISEIPAIGEDFDPNLHHAVQQMESEAVESGKISEVLQKGYCSGDKVIRPSMVVVAK